MICEWRLGLRRSYVWRACVWGVLLVSLRNANAAEALQQPRLNQVQVIGTHNSYHIAPAASVMALMSVHDKNVAKTLDYSHQPLTKQLDAGIRQLELDVFADPDGGLFAKPFVRASKQGQAEEGYHPAALAEPGFKILHVPDVDYRTSVPTLVAAMQQIVGWLDLHPDSAPIMVLLELKDQHVAPLPTRPIPFGPKLLNQLDTELRHQLGKRLFAPDNLRGDAPTLPAAIQQHGWPQLDAIRGRVLLALDNGGRVLEDYLAGHKALRGRTMFVNVPEDHAAAAYLRINDPVADFDRIQAAVRNGFLVRTRADADTIEARQNDTSRRQRAFLSGAQFISTDYPQPDTRFSDYRVQFPSAKTVRRNPVNGLEAPDREYDRLPSLQQNQRSQPSSLGNSDKGQSP